MPYERLASEQLAYIAGILDGEGYIGLVKQTDSRPNRGRATYYHPRISVAMTHRPTIEFLNAVEHGWKPNKKTVTRKLMKAHKG